jgi:hypothetical protein
MEDGKAGPTNLPSAATGTVSLRLIDRVATTPQAWPNPPPHP